MSNLSTRFVLENGLYQNILQVDHEVPCHNSYELHDTSRGRIHRYTIHASISGTEAAIPNISEWNRTRMVALTAFFICMHVLFDA